MRGSKALPLGTLLLTALCLVLAAPSAEARNREYSPHATILSVLQQSETVSSFSQLEVRQLHALLSSLDEAQLVELSQHLATLGIVETPTAAAPSFPFPSLPLLYSSLEPHLAAALCGVRTNAYLE
jgi:hypothetical protein